MHFVAFCFTVPTCSSSRPAPRDAHPRDTRSKDAAPLSAPRPAPVSAFLNVVSDEPDPAIPSLLRTKKHHSLCVFLTPSLVLATLHSVAHATSINVERHSYCSDGQLVHDCPLVDLALVQVTKPYLDLKHSPTLLQIPSSSPCLLKDPYSRQEFHFHMLLDRRRAFSPFYQTLPYLESDRSVPITGGWSGGVLLTAKKQIGGIVTGSDGEHRVRAVPGDFIWRFLRSYLRTELTFGALPVRYQTLDEKLAKYLGLESKMTGIRVTESVTPSIVAGDVITEIDGNRIDCDGLIDVQGGKAMGGSKCTDILSTVHVDRLGEGEDWPLAVPLEYFCALRPSDTTVQLRVLRAGAVIGVDVTLGEVTNGLDRPVNTRFVGIKGYIFTNLRVAYLREWGTHWQATCPPRLMAMANGILGRSQNPVVLTGLDVETDVEADEREQYASKFQDAALVSVNGQTVDCLETLQKHVKIPGDIVLEFDTGDLLVI